MDDDLKDFEREKISYEQNFEQARSLNAHLHRIPTLSMTLTGGLWFGIGLNKEIEPLYKSALLLFAGIGNVFLILVALKIRDVFQSYLEKISEFYPSTYADGRPNKPTVKKFGQYTMLTFYVFLMFIAAILSYLGAYFVGWHHSITWKIILVVVTLITVLTLVLIIDYAHLFDIKPKQSVNSESDEND